ncbi:MAG TPA: DNA primase [Candidatus Peribacterales bacterium]|nr:DNA primase [Candidatus Peribacterales bacterium]
MDPIPEIKARLPIEALVGEYCQIQKKGRNFVCLCPFHNDSHPSLLVSPEKGIAYCFACQSGGDIFSFYQKIEGVDFSQAIKDLAEKAGVTLPKHQFSQKGPTKDEKERLRECLHDAMLFYCEALKNTPHAMEYIEKRKVPPTLATSFAIGFAPDSFDATYTHLLKKGYSRTEIMRSGLGVQKELKEERIYDRFRNRIVFPIRDTQGNLIGFGGRTLGEDDAKYINSPDGPLYNKSVALFGLSHAKEAIRREKAVILVEGYFDVLAFHRIGIENVVAVSGTALTEQHVTVLKRIAEVMILCLDSDAAGKAAAERAYLLAKAQDMDVRYLALPTGKDPDECANVDPAAMKKACEGKGVPYLDHVLAECAAESMEKRTMLRILVPLLTVISSAVEREECVRKSAEVLGTTVTALEDDLRREQESLRKRQEEKSLEVASSPFRPMELLLGLLLAYPAHMKTVNELMEPEGEKEKRLFLCLRAFVASNRDALSMEDLPEDLREYASVLQLYSEQEFGTWSQDLARIEIRKLGAKVNRDMLKKKQTEIIIEIKKARADGKKMDEEILLTQYQQVLKLAAMAA